MALVTRFAPTPNGHLHLGNLYNLIWVSLLARKRGATVGLRIDDFDQSRFRREYLDSIFAVLHAVDFRWTVGPRDSADFLANFSSRWRRDQYREAEIHLEESARTYWCVCTRRVGARGCTGNCRAQDYTSETRCEGLRAQLRFEVNDLIVIPREGDVAYQVASIVDDLHFGFDFLVRGEDLRSSSQAQLALAPEMKAEAFLKTEFYHHPLLRAEDGAKLSKSQKADPVMEILKKRAGLGEILHDFAHQELGVPKKTSVPAGLQEFCEAMQTCVSLDERPQNS